METYKSLSELFADRKNDDPDVLLSRIAAFFNEAGRRYRRGLISEEEFYLATYYNAGFGDDSLYAQLWAMKGVSVNEPQLSRVKTLQASFLDWKRDGAIPEDPLVRQCIRCDGSFEDAVEWVFRVIDVCKVPFCAFEAIPISDVGRFPSVMWAQDGGEARIIFVPACLDDGGLLRDPAPEGKSYKLRFDGGMIASLTVKTTEGSGPKNRRFACEGTVTDYVEEPQLLEITTSTSGYLELTFGRRSASEWALVSHTALMPIPHFKWARFNEVHFAFSLRRETEYRILRLPYLFGGTVGGPSPQKEETGGVKQGRMVRVQHIGKLKGSAHR